MATDQDQREAPLSERLLVDVQGAAALLSISERQIRRLRSAGKFPEPVKLGGAVRYRVSDLRAMLEGGDL
jgi:predicted DNA-binding transcriptional regulator AlpA